MNVRTKIQWKYSFLIVVLIQSLSMAQPEELFPKYPLKWLASPTQAIRTGTLTATREKRKRLCKRIMDVLSKEVKSNRSNRNHGSPLQRAILVASRCRVKSAEPIFFDVIDYEIDSFSIPLGMSIGSSCYIPATFGLVSLRVDPDVVIKNMAKETKERRLHLLTWILVQRTRSEKAAQRLMQQANADGVFAGEVAKKAYSQVAKRLEGKVDLPKLSPPGKRRQRGREPLSASEKQLLAGAKDRDDTVEALLKLLKKNSGPANEDSSYRSIRHCLLLALDVWRPIGNRRAEGWFLRSVDYEIAPHSVPKGVTLKPEEYYPAIGALVRLRPDPRKLIKPLAIARREKNIRLLSWILVKTAGSSKRAKELLAAEKGYYFSRKENQGHYDRVMKYLDMDPDKLLPSPK
jgi:hypothetical protein